MSIRELWLLGVSLSTDLDRVRLTGLVAVEDALLVVGENSVRGRRVLLFFLDEDRDLGRNTKSGILGCADLAIEI